MHGTSASFRKKIIKIPFSDRKLSKTPYELLPGLHIYDYTIGFYVLYSYKTVFI
jgi:hypothetical protein